MDKEILEKIYLLRKIGPEKDRVSAMKRNILHSSEKREEKIKVSVWDYLASPLTQNGLTVAGAFAFLFFFGYLTFPLLPSNYDYVTYIPPSIKMAERENLNMVPEDEKESVEIAERKKPIEKDFATLKETLHGLQRQVLGTRIEDEGLVEVDTWSDKDIVEYYIAKIEGEEESGGVTTMGVQEEDEKLEMLKKANEEEDYGEAFNIIVDILSE